MASHLHLYIKQKTYQRPHLPNELKAVASAQNLPSPMWLPPLSCCIITINPSSAESFLPHTERLLEWMGKSPFLE